MAGTVRGSGSPPGEAHRLPFEATSNRTARRLLTAYLVGTALPEALAQDATIVLGELVANCLDHGRPDPDDGLVVSWCVQGARLELSVCDGGGATTRPHVVQAGPWAARGRGLAMVQALSAQWWVDDGPGTRVTAVLAATP